MSSEVALAKCADYSTSSVEQAIRGAIALLGGIDKFIKPNSRVLIKPNLLVAREPGSGIVTHPQIVRAVIHLLKDINAKIYLGDSPSAWFQEAEQIELVWEKSGIKQVAEEEGVELVRFSKSYWQGELLLTNWLADVDYLISLPKFKTHDLTILTGAIKNLFGLIPGRYKIELHKRHFTPANFARMLVDLYEVVKPTLTIVDGVLALEGEGPGSRGIKRNLGLIVAGADCVGIDSILALIMGLKPEDILTTKEAGQRNLGSTRIEDIEILGEQPASFKGKPFKLPITKFQHRLPKPIIKLAAKLIRFYPIIDSRLCSRCGVCIKTCPQEVIKQKQGRIIIDCSGCIACFCCQEACPDAAIGIRRSLITRLLQL